MAKKKKDLTLPVLQGNVLEGIDPDRVKELAVNISNLCRDNFTLEQIGKVLGISPPMIAAIQRTDYYQKSVHELVKDDGDTFRAALRASSSTVAATLAELAMAGNVKAIALFAKIMGADSSKEDKSTDSMVAWIKWMDRLGHKNVEDENTERIKLLDNTEGVIDADYEIDQMISDTLPETEDPLDEFDDE